MLAQIVPSFARLGNGSLGGAHQKFEVRSKYGWQCMEDVAQNVFHISCEDKSIDKS